MKKGQNTQKLQKTINVYFSETLNVFYVKPKYKHTAPGNFMHLITCENSLLNDFLKYLEQFIDHSKPKMYKYEEIKNKLNEFLIKRANNCKVIGNVEAN